MTSFKRKIEAKKPSDKSWEEFDKENQTYYKEIEKYDWTDTADHLRGPETLMHKWREYWVMNLVNKYANPQHALDIGCGTGLILRHLPEGSIGVDINPRNLERLPKYAPGRTAIIADVQDHLPFADNTFDTITAAEVLEHLVFPEKALSEIYRVLKPGGVFVGSVPQDNWFWNLRSLSVTYHKMGQIEEPFHNEMHLPELKSLLATTFRTFKVYPYYLTNFFFVAWKESDGPS